jgi:hypothetical protein
MHIDKEKIDQATLALLFLTWHDVDRAWKGHDWETLNRLHARGLIHDPVNKTKSIIFTPEGLAEARRLFEEKFTLPETPGA